MKRFIRYLYEYEQEKRMRNVGFVKVEQEEDECMVHIHGKGLRMGSDKSLQIYLLFEDGGTCFGIWQGEADNVNPAVNECISYTPEETGIPENYEKIGGIVLENRDGRRFAALWNETPMDISGMRIWKRGKGEETGITETEELLPGEQSRKEASVEKESPKGQLSEEVTEREEPSVGEEPLKGQFLEETSAEEAPPRGQLSKEVPAGKEPLKGQLSEEVPAEEELPEKEAEPEDIMGAVPAIRSEGVFFTDSAEKPRPQQKWRIRKIQRTELAKLARCEWRLANNNFLLHGYYNYHHLILLERGEQDMLGVPGIYHEKEAAAAGAFGFPEFIAKDRLELKLEPEECNDDHPFGYWCRPVKRAFKWE